MRLSAGGLRYALLVWIVTALLIMADVVVRIFAGILGEKVPVTVISRDRRRDVTVRIDPESELAPKLTSGATLRFSSLFYPFKAGDRLEVLVIPDLEFCYPANTYLYFLSSHMIVVLPMNVLLSLLIIGHARPVRAERKPGDDNSHSTDR